MHAVVLVGGFGTRLRPLTFEIPKPLLPVCNVPLLERLMTSLAHGGVTHAVLALGFKPEPFLKAFPSNRCAGVELSYAVEDRPLDTSGAIGFAAREAKINERGETFIVANGDIITDLNIAELVAFHRSANAEGTIHLTPVADPSQYGVVETNTTGKVIRFVEKPKTGETLSRHVNGGTYIFQTSALERMPGTAPLSIERETFPEMVRDGVLFAFATDDYWIDAGRPDTYVRSNVELLSRKSIHQVTPMNPKAKIHPTARVTHSTVGANCVIGENAQVVRSVLMDGARVDANAEVIDSAVMGHIGAFARVTSCLIGAAGEVNSGAVLRDAKVPDPNNQT